MITIITCELTITMIMVSTFVGIRIEKYVVVVTCSTMEGNSAENVVAVEALEYVV